MLKIKKKLYFVKINNMYLQDIDTDENQLNNYLISAIKFNSDENYYRYQINEKNKNNITELLRKIFNCEDLIVDFEEVEDKNE